MCGYLLVAWPIGGGGRHALRKFAVNAGDNRGDDLLTCRAYHIARPGATVAARPESVT